MATQTTEQALVHSVDKAFQAILKSNPEIGEAIEAILWDALVEKGWSIHSLLDWKASFDVTFIEETYEDEE